MDIDNRNMAKYNLVFLFLILLCTKNIKAQNIKKNGYLLADSTLLLDIYPKFPGGKNKLRIFTHQQLYDSKIYNEKMFRKKCRGYIFVKYNIDTTGKSNNIMINYRNLYFDNKKYSKEVQFEILQELQTLLTEIFTKMPIWESGYLNGKKQSVEVISPILINP